MAIHHVDYINGQDKPTVINAVASNPTGTTVLITYPYGGPKHGLTTGEQVVLSLFTAYLNGTRTITVVNEYSFTLDGISWATTSDPNGTVTPVTPSANDGSTWALARKSVDSIPIASLSAGDIVKIAKSPDPVSIGSVAWVNRAIFCTTGTALTQLIENAILANWTLTAGVTQSAYTTARKIGASSLALVLPATGTGKMAYKTLSSTLNLSAYTNLSFWEVGSNTIYHNLAGLRICLCSDASGDTVVDNFVIPPNFSATYFKAHVIAKGGAMGSSINSIAIYKDNVIAAALTLRLNNIFAANGLNLLSMIGKSNAVNSKWYGIAAIENDKITFDNCTFVGYYRGTNETTETIESYIRTGIELEAAAEVGVFNIPNKSGNGDLEADRITYTGGWNTATNEQDGESWFDGLSYRGWFNYDNGSRTNIAFDRINAQRYNYGLYKQDNNVAIIHYLNLSTINCFRGAYVGSGSYFTNVKLLSHNHYGIYFIKGITYFNGLILENIGGVGSSPVPYAMFSEALKQPFIYGENLYIDNNRYGMYLNAATVFLKDGYYGAYNDSDPRFNGTEVEMVNFTNLHNQAYNQQGRIVLKDSIWTLIPIVGTGSIITILNHNQVAAKNYTLLDSYLYAEYKSDVSFGTTTGVWEIGLGVRVNSIEADSMIGVYATKMRRIFLEIAKIAVEANVQVTVSLWVKRVKISQAGSKGCALIVRGKHSSPVTTDVITEFGDGLYEWTLVGLTFTPETTGIIAVELWLYYDVRHYLQISTLNVAT